MAGITEALQAATMQQALFDDSVSPLMNQLQAQQQAQMQEQAMRNELTIKNQFREAAKQRAIEDEMRLMQERSRLSKNEFQFKSGINEDVARKAGQRALSDFLLKKGVQAPLDASGNINREQTAGILNNRSIASSLVDEYAQLGGDATQFINPNTGMFDIDALTKGIGELSLSTAQSGAVDAALTDEIAAGRMSMQEASDIRNATPSVVVSGFGGEFYDPDAPIRTPGVDVVDPQRDLLSRTRERAVESASEQERADIAKDIAKKSQIALSVNNGVVDVPTSLATNDAIINQYQTELASITRQLNDNQKAKLVQAQAEALTLLTDDDDFQEYLVSQPEEVSPQQAAYAYITTNRPDIKDVVDARLGLTSEEALQFGKIQQINERIGDMMIGMTQLQGLAVRPASAPQNELTLRDVMPPVDSRPQQAEFPPLLSRESPSSPTTSSSVIDGMFDEDVVASADLTQESRPARRTNDNAVLAQDVNLVPNELGGFSFQNPAGQTIPVEADFDSSIAALGQNARRASTPAGQRVNEFMRTVVAKSVGGAEDDLVSSISAFQKGFRRPDDARRELFSNFQDYQSEIAVRSFDTYPEFRQEYMQRFADVVNQYGLSDIVDPKMYESFPELAEMIQRQAPNEISPL